MKKTIKYHGLFVLAVAIIAGCSIDEPRELGEVCEASFVQLNSGDRIELGDGGEYDFYLDIGKDLIRELKRYVEWKQVPLTIKETLYLEEAYDSNMFYADGVQIGEEFFFFVAPAEPDMRYNKGDFVRLALPYFYDVSYLPDLNGKLLKLIQPAVLVSDDNGRFTLKEKGKIAIAR